MVNTKEDIYIYGKNAVLETLHSGNSEIEKIFIRDSLKKKDIKTILKLASQQTVPVTHVPGQKLHQLVGSVNDQGVVALISAATYINFESWSKDLDMEKNPAVLVLDEIEDPHNFGAIIRSAAAFGISAVIIGKHRQAPVNAVVFKTSAGTVNHIPIIRVVNLNQTIQHLKELGFWIGGLSVDAEETIWNQRFDMPLAFVVGNEGSGIRVKTLEHCDFQVSIPLPKSVESLNASASAAVLCYEWKRRRSLE